MAYAHVNGIDMHYEVRGTGPPVVLAHGVGGNSLGWWQQLTPFGERYQVIVFDHRSFGLSTDDGRGAAAFVDDLEALLDVLGIDDVALVGQSMGGFTCAGFAHRHPDRVRALVLSGSLAGLSTPPPPQVIDAFLAKAADWEGFVHAEVGRGGFPQRSPDLFTLYGLMSGLNLRASSMVLETIVHTRYDIAPIVAAEIPVLLINGEEDDRVGVAMAGLAAQLPRARTATIPASGHLAYFEKADEYNRLVLGFLDEHLQDDAASHVPAASGSDRGRP